MEMPCAIFSILWEKFTVLWPKSKNEPTIAAPTLIRSENSVCSSSVLSPSFLPVASNDDINHRFEKENKGFMTLVLINTLEQSARKAWGTIKARVFALSGVTFFPKHVYRLTVAGMVSPVWLPLLMMGPFSPFENICIWSFSSLWTWRADERNCVVDNREPRRALTWKPTCTFKWKPRPSPWGIIN